MLNNSKTPLPKYVTPKPILILFVAALLALPVSRVCQSAQAERYNIFEMTDLASLPEEIYDTVVYGPLEVDVSSRLVNQCEPLSAYSWRDSFGSNPYSRTSQVCKAFRYPIVILLQRATEIHGIPCNGGLVAFYQSERLAYCTLSARVLAGPDVLEPGDPISFDEQGNYRYPSETRSSTIRILSAPQRCLAVTVTNAATNVWSDLGATPTSNVGEVRLWLIKCQCADGEVHVARRVCIEDCTHTFTCGSRR
jgi:hypothetical protein